MPHTKSAKKSLRKTEKRRLHNRVVKRAMKKQLRKFEDTLAEGSPEQVQAEVKLAFKKLDKAAAKRVIHPNTAARKKSQLATAINNKAKAPAAKA